MGVRHPSLWAWIRILKDQYAVNQTEMKKVRDRRPPPKRRLKWRRLENKIKDLKEPSELLPLGNIGTLLNM